MSTPLRELLNGILFDPSTRAAFSSDPRSFLQQHGWDDLDAVDVHTALTALVDDLPIARAVIVAPAVDTATPNGLSSEGSAFDGAINGLVAAASTVHPDADLADLHHDLDSLPDNGLDDGLDDALDAFDAGSDNAFEDGEHRGALSFDPDSAPAIDEELDEGVIADGDGLDEPALADDVNLLDDSPFDDANFEDTNIDGANFDGANFDQEAEPIDLDDDGGFGID